MNQRTLRTIQLRVPSIRHRVRMGWLNAVSVDSQFRLCHGVIVEEKLRQVCFCFTSEFGTGSLYMVCIETCLHKFYNTVGCLYYHGFFTAIIIVFCFGILVWFTVSWKHYQGHSQESGTVWLGTLPYAISNLHAAVICVGPLLWLLSSWQQPLRTDWHVYVTYVVSQEADTRRICMGCV